MLGVLGNCLTTAGASKGSIDVSYIRSGVGIMEAGAGYLVVGGVSRCWLERKWRGG